MCTICTHPWNQRILHELYGVRNTRILRDTDIVELRFTGSGVVYDVLKNGTESDGGGVDGGLGCW